MTLNEYAELAQRTSNTYGMREKLENAMLGLVGEAGEVVDLWKKFRFQGHPLDKERMIEEFSDAMWYIVEGITALGCTLDEAGTRNIGKLKKRYPHGFEANRSLHRD